MNQFSVSEGAGKLLQRRRTESIHENGDGVAARERKVGGDLFDEVGRDLVRALETGEVLTTPGSLMYT